MFTGELDSLEREQAVDLVKRYGGCGRVLLCIIVLMPTDLRRVTGSVSKKTNFVVLGEEPGASKVAKITELGVKTISEDELLAMIAARPAQDMGAAPASPKAKKAAKDKDDFRSLMRKPAPAAAASDDDGDMLLDDADLEDLDTIPAAGSKRPASPPPAAGAASSSSSSPKRVAVETATGRSASQPVAASSPAPRSAAVGVSASQPVYASTASTSQAGASSYSQPSQSGVPPASSGLLLSDRYRPTEMKNIIGNKANVDRLFQWLRAWYGEEIKIRKGE